MIIHNLCCLMSFGHLRNLERRHTIFSFCVDIGSIVQQDLHCFK